MKNMDKYIKMNISYVSNDMGIMTTLVICVFFCFIFLHLLPLAAILLALGLGLLVKIYKKLFYQGLFGERALLEQTLPVTARETVVSKIFVATCGRIIFEAASVAMVMSVWLMGRVDIGISKETLIFLIPETVEPGQLPMTAGLVVLAAIIQCFCQSAMIFAAVVWYNTLPKKDRKFPAKLLAAVALLAMGAILTQIRTSLGEIHIMIGEGVMAAMALALGLFMCRMAEKRLQSRYCI